MKHLGLIVGTIVIGVAGFFGGREARGRFAPAAPVASPVTAAATPVASSDALVVNVRARPQFALPGKATAPAAPSLAPGIERALSANIVEPPDVTEGRRKIALAELAQKTPNLSQEKRDFMLRENDRLALNKRKLRAAFLDGQLGEAEYTEALKDDIRAAVTSYEQVLSDSEFQALTHRVKGAGDPFDMSSLSTAPAPNKDAPPPTTSDRGK